MEEFFGIIRLDAAAVLDANFGRGGGIEDVGQCLADKGVGFLGLRGRGGATGADGPDGFISNDRVEHPFGVESGQAAAELLGQNLVMTVGVALLEGFADAKDGAEAGGVGGFDLFVHQLVGLAEDDAAFAVPEDHIAGEKFAEHTGADFAGESARRFMPHILCAEGDAGKFGDDLGETGEGGEGRDNDDFRTVEVFQFQLEVLHERGALGGGHVHLPIRSNDLFTHKGEDFAVAAAS